MKKTLKLICLLLLALGGYAFYIMQSTGYFKKITPNFDGEIIDSIFLPGVEDMQISYQDSFLILSSDNRAARRDGQQEQGHLYFLDLKQNNWQPHLLTKNLNIPFFPHGISVLRLKGDHYRIWAINHVKGHHSLEVFDLFGDSLVHLQTLTDPSMISPNDVVAIDANRFYFTNDHAYTKGLKKFAEDYLGWAVSNVVYYNGSNYEVVADGIAYANGINMDQERQLLYVASPRAFLVKVYQIESDGQLQYIEDIDCGTGVDNIELAPDGQLWIGAHPNLLAYAAYAKGKQATAPSEIITIDYQSKGSYHLQSIYMEDGQQMSASTVAIPWSNYIFTGNVMDDHFLILKNK